MCLVSWWWLVWSRWLHRSATACFFRNTGTTSINFPVWYDRWWSNFCECWEGYTWKHHGSLLWIGNAYILYRRQAYTSTGFQGLDMFDSSKYFATTSALTWCIVVKLVFHTTSLLSQLPKNDSVFLDISGRLFLKIHEDGFSVPLQLVFLPFLMKFLMKGLVRWVPFLYGVFSLWMHADS